MVKQKHLYQHFLKEREKEIEINAIYLNKQKEKIKELTDQLEDFKKSVAIEKEDGKQKIIKIIEPSYFNTLNSDVVIVYGNIKANQIDAKNVICIKGNIDGNIAADRVVGVPSVKDAQTDFRSHHKKCQYCKFYKEKKSFSWSPSYYQCEVSGNILKKNKARFCKYYEVK